MVRVFFTLVGWNFHPGENLRVEFSPENGHQDGIFLLTRQKMDQIPLKTDRNSVKHLKFFACGAKRSERIVVFSIATLFLPKIYEIYEKFHPGEKEKHCQLSASPVRRPSTTVRSRP